MDSSISIPLDMSGVVPPALPSLARPLSLPLVEPKTQLEAPPIARSRLQPHLGYATLLSLGLFGVLTFVNTVWTMVAVAVIIAGGGEITPTALVEFGMANASAVLLTLFGASCIYCVGVAAIAFRGQLVERLSIRKFTTLQLFAVVLLAMPLAIVISSLAVAIMSAFGMNMNDGSVIDNPPTLAIALFTIAVLPAIGEEIFFRGLLSRGLIARHGLILGVIFATALFALVHVNPVQVFVIFFMGLVMQAVFMWTRSILASILLHGLYNATIVIFARNASAHFSHVAEAAALPSFVVALITVIALLVVLYQTRTRWQLPDGGFWSPGYVATDMPPRGLQATAFNAPAKLLPLMVAMLGMTALVLLTTLSLLY
jgi:membrane protease YdiL (CAAX protease family)